MGARDRIKRGLYWLVVAAGFGAIWFGGYHYLVDHDGRAQDNSALLSFIGAAVVAYAVLWLSDFENKSFRDQADARSKALAEQYKTDLARETRELEEHVERLEVSVDEKWTRLIHLQNMTYTGAIQWWEPKIWAELTRIAVMTEALRDQVSRYANGVAAATRQSIEDGELDGTDELARVEAVIASLREFNGELEFQLTKKVAEAKKAFDQDVETINFMRARLDEARANATQSEPGQASQA